MADWPFDRNRVAPSGCLCTPCAGGRRCRLELAAGTRRDRRLASVGSSLTPDMRLEVHLGDALVRECHIQNRGVIPPPYRDHPVLGPRRHLPGGRDLVDDCPPEDRSWRAHRMRIQYPVTRRVIVRNRSWPLAAKLHGAPFIAVLTPRTRVVGPRPTRRSDLAPGLFDRRPRLQPVEDAEIDELSHVGIKSERNRDVL